MAGSIRWNSNQMANINVTSLIRIHAYTGCKRLTSLTCPSKCHCPFCRQTPCPMNHRFKHRGLTVVVMVHDYSSSRPTYRVLHITFHFFFLVPSKRISYYPSVACISPSCFGLPDNLHYRSSPQSKIFSYRICRLDPRQLCLLQSVPL